MSSGTGHFIAQRASAIALALLGCWFAVALAGLDSFTYVDAHPFVADGTNAILLGLLVATTAYHSWLGVEVVLEDYVHAKGLLRFSLAISAIAHGVLAIAAIVAIYRIGGGL